MAAWANLITLVTRHGSINRRSYGSIGIPFILQRSLISPPGQTAYAASKFALRGMTECWRGELRKHNIRVCLVNPSEVITNFGAAAGFEQKVNETKLRPADIAHAVKTVLEMEDRGFIPELAVFATNPVD